MTTTTLKIGGMTCGHCVQSVEKALASVPGVQKAVVSLADQSAAVTHDGPLDLPVIIKAMEEEGYRITE
jgi:copper chaperone CopZ